MAAVVEAGARPAARVPDRPGLTPRGNAQMAIASPGLAFWNQRHVLAALAPRLRQMIDAVGRPTDLSLRQWNQLISFALEFQPDLIIELGRGHGNSTCCFLETARHIEERGGRCRLVSLCLSDTWAAETVKRLKPICDSSWFARGNVLTKNILEHDFEVGLAGAKRVFLFWDAHGVVVADCVLSRIMPLLASRLHVVAMHDMCHTVYDMRKPKKAYGDAHIWDGECATTNFFRVNGVQSSVTQAILAMDFTERNDVPLHAAAEGLHHDVVRYPERVAELKQLLGEELVKQSAMWFWFSLNEAPGELTFP